MSRRSRNNTGPPITLFSFQDIMTTVMGILILVTLMMALDLIHSVGGLAAATTQPAADAAPALPPAEAAALETRAAELDSRYQQQLAKVGALAQGGHQPASIREALTRLQATQQQVRELERKIAALRTQGTGPATVKTRQIEEIVQLEQRAAQLRGEAADLRGNARLTYIVQAQAGKRAVLIELSGSSIGLGAPNPRASALWFDNPSPATRRQVLLAVTGQYDMGQDYFVILVKPSGFRFYQEIVDDLRHQGFDVGTEVIDEAHTVLARSPNRPARQP